MSSSFFENTPLLRLCFSFNIHKGYLYPNDEKAEIVKFVFNNYSTGQVGVRKLASMVRKKYNMPQFTKGYLEHILWNSVYYGVCTKKRNLSVEEYSLFGADKPGEYIEQFEIKTIDPLISKEMFEKCQLVSRLKTPYEGERTGVAIYPKIFKCSCGRNMKRTDKKIYRYLSCSKHINLKFPNRCYEPHTNMRHIDGDVEDIVRSWLLSKYKRDKLLTQIDEREKEGGEARSKQLGLTLAEIGLLQSKQEEITLSYTNDTLGKKVYQKATEQIQHKLNEKNKTIVQLERKDVISQSLQKMRGFIKILGDREKKLAIKDSIKKSSLLYSMFFKGVGNSLISGRKQLSYASFAPFDICEFLDKGQWHPQRELNSRRAALETAALPLSYGDRISICTRTYIQIYILYFKPGC